MPTSISMSCLHLEERKNEAESRSVRPQRKRASVSFDVSTSTSTDLAQNAADKKRARRTLKSCSRSVGRFCRSVVPRSVAMTPAMSLANHKRCPNGDKSADKRASARAQRGRAALISNNKTQGRKEHGHVSNAAPGLSTQSYRSFAP